MILSANVFFDDKTSHNNMLLERMSTEIPADFVRMYKKNVVGITPAKSFGLRRSIITQVLGNTGTIGWRVPYAAAQNAGGHTVNNPVIGKIREDHPRAGEFSIIPVGYYPYSNGAKGFAQRAFIATKEQMPAQFKTRGYTT